MDSKTIFIDIDGTLRDHSFGVPPSASEALRDAAKAGHHLIICTGRTRGLIPDDIPLELFSGIVAGGGCYIEHKAKILRDLYISKEIIEKYSSMFDKSGIPYGLETQQGIFMSEEMAEIISKILEIRKDSEAERLEESTEKISTKSSLSIFRLSPLPVSKISFCLTYEQYKHFCINEDVLRLIRLNSDPDGYIHCEMILNGCDKGSGLKLYCEYTHTDIKDTIAVGDSMNDVDMFEAAALSICMGNASEEVKSKADIVTKPLLSDGLYFGFRRAGVI